MTRLSETSLEQELMASVLGAELHDLSHDLHRARNALRSLDGVVSPDEGDAGREIERARESLSAALASVERLDAMSRFVWRGPGARHPVDVAAALLRAARSGQDLADRRPGPVEVHPPHMMVVCEVLAASRLLDVAFWNIVSNAVEYTLPGGIVSCGCDRAGECVKADVVNVPALPIDDDELPRVFAPGFRGRAAELTTSMRRPGLGLSVARFCVGKCEGSVALTQTRLPSGDRKVTCTVSLPALGPERPRRARTGPPRLRLSE